MQEYRNPKWGLNSHACVHFTGHGTIVDEDAESTRSNTNNPEPLVTKSEGSNHSIHLYCEFF